MAALPPSIFWNTWWGTLGLIYNANMVDGELDSWGALYDDAHAGNVLLINAGAAMISYSSGSSSSPYSSS